MLVVPLHDEVLLLQQLAVGNQRAFKKIFDHYHQPLASYVYQVTESVTVSEEIIQDIFVKIWLKREEMSTIASLKDYLFILCRNRTIDALRKKARHALQKAEVDKYLLEEAELATLDNPADVYRQWITEAVELLPPQQQMVYKLSRYDRLKHEEIAAQLNVSKETVKKHIQLAVKFLESQLKERMDPPILALLLMPMFATL
ncbi:RNA polymerase sigma-70 factor [Sphingobacterium psychroaquaticum]|uniref:RNA polymerase sigma-70 factor, ECF subfamily n=1 Tax=Sphingobacterium psychroaquaticum TaxID=561061 RepID=A0A1X7IP51_9SPHI|nr:RNA polymerase sigma-70 factor [Sphingobacterium psychroaquaticum]SMG16504.1 RNA polymerase sigma-70 factor, ECF subfamily [Sphingobacterium psychroaquaticum]